jgi:hypothetical protein
LRRAGRFHDHRAPEENCAPQKSLPPDANSILQRAIPSRNFGDHCERFLPDGASAAMVGAREALSRAAAQGIDRQAFLTPRKYR